MELSERCKLSCEILKKTNDGDDLSPNDLHLIEICVNGAANELGYENLKTLHSEVMAGTYKKPWLCGVEHLTKDHEGYVYWKGVHVEHYSFSDYEKEKQAAQELAKRCRDLESHGIKVNCGNAIWLWGAHPFQKKQA